MKMTNFQIIHMYLHVDKNKKKSQKKFTLHLATWFVGGWKAEKCMWRMPGTTEKVRSLAHVGSELTSVLQFALVFGDGIVICSMKNKYDSNIFRIGQ